MLPMEEAQAQARSDAREQGASLRMRWGELGEGFELCRRGAAAGASVGGLGRDACAGGSAPHCRRRLVVGAAAWRCRALLWRGGGEGSRQLAPLPVQCADSRCGSRMRWGRRASLESVIARQLAFWREYLAGLPRCHFVHRPAAACGCEPPRGSGADCAVARPACGAGWACARVSGPAFSMVLNACLAGLRTLSTPRHSDWQPDCRAHRQRARRSGGLFCQHAGAGPDRSGNPAPLSRAYRAGSGGQPCCLQPSGCAV